MRLQIRGPKKCTEQSLNDTDVNIEKVLGSPIYYLRLSTMKLEWIKKTLFTMKNNKFIYIYFRLFYFNDAEVTQFNFHPLLILADKYEVSRLFQHMTEFIKSVVDVDNAMICWSLSLL